MVLEIIETVDSATLEKPYERKKTFTNGWYGPGKSLYPSPLIRPVEYLLPVRKISFAIKKKVDSATPGKLFVQNDIRVR